MSGILALNEHDALVVKLNSLASFETPFIKLSTLAFLSLTSHSFICSELLPSLPAVPAQQHCAPWVSLHTDVASYERRGWVCAWRITLNLPTISCNKRGEVIAARWPNLTVVFIRTPSDVIGLFMGPWGILRESVGGISRNIENIEIFGLSSLNSNLR